MVRLRPSPIFNQILGETSSLHSPHIAPGPTLQPGFADLIDGGASDTKRPSGEDFVKWPHLLTRQKVNSIDAAVLNRLRVFDPVHVITFKISVNNVIHTTNYFCCGIKSLQ